MYQNWLKLVNWLCSHIPVIGPLVWAYLGGLGPGLGLISEDLGPRFGPIFWAGFASTSGGGGGNVGGDLQGVLGRPLERVSTKSIFKYHFEIDKITFS